MARAPRAPKIDHNPKAEPGDNSLEEAERIQLISFVSRLTAADGEIAAAQAPLKNAQAQRKQVVNLAKAAGFTAEELKARMKEMNDPARDNPQKIARETRHRRWLGIIRPEDDQGRLDLAPAEVQDEAHWAGEGYKAGLRQMERKPPPECAERFVQPWLARYDLGLKEVLTANAPKSMTAVRDRAAADFKDDNPEVDVEAAARRLRNDPKFMARGADTEEGAKAGEGGENAAAPEASVDTAGDKPAGAEEPFEATEEELQGQAPRRAIQERRAAEEGEPEPVV